jgi:hypothetical protein
VILLDINMSSWPRESGACGSGTEALLELHTRILGNPALILDGADKRTEGHIHQPQIRAYLGC